MGGAADRSRLKRARDSREEPVKVSSVPVPLPDRVLAHPSGYGWEGYRDRIHAPAGAGKPGKESVSMDRLFSKFQLGDIKVGERSSFPPDAQIRGDKGRW